MEMKMKIGNRKYTYNCFVVAFVRGMPATI